jgi:hypothetical protein
MKNFLRSIFGCSHENLSVPFTLPVGRRKSKRTYKVCLDCSKQFPYNAKTFTLKPERSSRRTRAHKSNPMPGLIRRAEQCEQELEAVRQ